jgi:hypothetical protein
MAALPQKYSPIAMETAHHLRHGKLSQCGLVIIRYNELCDIFIDMASKAPPLVGLQ